jgi:hypothetical protein
MPHDTTLIATVVAGLILAFIGGVAASKLRLPPLVGYLLAGVAVGPFTPGFVADQALALQLAEIGIILLMFGVGLHFSIADLLAVRRIAVPGVVAQIRGRTGERGSERVSSPSPGGLSTRSPPGATGRPASRTRRATRTGFARPPSRRSARAP